MSFMHIYCRINFQHVWIEMSERQPKVYYASIVYDMRGGQMGADTRVHARDN